MATFSYEEIEYRYNPYTKQLEKIDLSDKIINDIKAEIEINKEDIALTVAQLDGKANKAFILSEINLSTEGVRISGDKIEINGDVTFSSGYDPSTKINTSGAAADINANTTTVSGGKITTGTITANKMNVSELSAISANIGDITAGTITGVIVTGGTLRTASSGKRIQIDSSNGIRAIDSSGATRIRLTDSGGDSNPTLSFFDSIGTNVGEIRPGDLGGTESNGIYISNNIGIPSNKKYYIGDNYIGKSTLGNIPIWGVYSGASFGIPVLTASGATATPNMSITFSIQAAGGLKHYKINCVEA